MSSQALESAEDRQRDRRGSSVGAQLGIMILRPQRPTWARWKRLATSRFSTLRTLQYERIRGLSLSGAVLDVGGGSGVSYAHLLRVEGPLESANVDPSMSPTHVCDASQLCVPSQRYDHVLCFNTLEHLYMEDTALGEIHRVLKTGGDLHALVPFIYRVHGSPSDFHRHTAQYWTIKLRQVGFGGQVVIEALGFGALVAAFSLVEYGLPARLRHWTRSAVMALDLVLQPVRRVRDLGCSLPLGYYIRATK